MRFVSIQPPQGSSRTSIRPSGYSVTLTSPATEEERGHSTTLTMLRSFSVLFPCFLIRLYQRWVSPMFPPVCRFTPSCSAYALESYQRHGLAAGTVLTVRRLARCGPWCRGGYDPVPQRPVVESPRASRCERGSSEGLYRNHHLDRDEAPPRCDIKD